MIKKLDVLPETEWIVLLRNFGKITSEKITWRYLLSFLFFVLHSDQIVECSGNCFGPEWPPRCLDDLYKGARYVTRKVRLHTSVNLPIGGATSRKMN